MFQKKMPNVLPKPVALSIAGFDPSGCVGVLADLKTFAAHDCYGVAAVTAIAAQNTTEIRRLAPVDCPVLKQQIETLLDDVALAGVKIGLLGSRRNIEVAAELLAARPDPPLVLDPVTEEAEPLAKLLLPRALVFTPGALEAGRLLGIPVDSLDDMKGAAKLLADRGVPHVVIKGSHLEKPVDVYYDGHDFEVFSGHRHESQNPYGIGCTFSSAILANLAHGKAVREAIVLAKAYVSQAIARSYPIGAGRAPLNHLFRFNDGPSRVTGPDPIHEVPQPH